ncbi:MAG: hypothetical protein J2P29_12390, partial [Actinobacteria bacterium]|nr:hypothetical protein [Actinomycetota bacterium]
VMLVLFLLQSKPEAHPSFASIAAILAGMLFFLGVAYTPWMASFTETVEHRNPAAVATGLAIWGWIIRVVVFGSSLAVLFIITSVTPLLTGGAYLTQYPSLAWAQAHPKVVADATKYSSELGFAGQHPDIVALAQKDATQIANAQQFAPELAIIQAHVADFTQAAKYTSPSAIPATLQAKLVADAGGGAAGQAELAKIQANQAAITGVIAVQSDLAKLQPFTAQLTALSQVPPSVLQEAQANSAELTALQKVPASVTSYLQKQTAPAAATAPGQWKTWYWVCVGGLVFFLLSVPLLRGRWSPRKARQDEEAHEAMVQAELAKLQGATSS